jgi:starch phosphorylase
MSPANALTPDDPPCYLEVPAQPVVHVPLPPRLEGLRRLAYNLYWTWHPRVISLFKRIDAHAWVHHRNPVPVLQAKTDWGELLDHPEFMAEYETVLAGFDRYLAGSQSSWFTRRKDAGQLDARFRGPVAYFCAEFGLHEHLQIYSGGLGVLAGDHLKTASDMGLPLVAVGLFYRQGYFRQSIDADGHQEHAYPALEPHQLPVLRAIDPRSGRPLQVAVSLPGREVQCGVWVVRVGRVNLLLLDTDIPENADSDRPITAQLYVRGREMRLHQELMLGVGGTRALRALGIEPQAWHLNEGHSAFMLVERLRELCSAGVPFDEALARVKKSAIFTIHTPVSAGNEKFEAAHVRRLAQPLAAGTSVDLSHLIELGQGVDESTTPMFDMTAFSLRMSGGSNAVSQLHAVTANATWAGIMGGRTILGITNGVHMGTWLGQAVRWLCEDVGISLEDLDLESSTSKLLEHIRAIDDRKLWEGRQRQKLELAFFARARLRRQLARHGEAPDVLGGLNNALDPGILTIGFARRFATYKRAALLFSDEDRLARLLFSKERPVQLVFAGKAHPADRPGQKVIEQLFQKSRSTRFRGRVFVLEDYDMRIGRFMVNGVDVWLNNPRRPLEASGTSGMKAAANGIPSLSILDGWWDEGYDGDNGWAIGGRDTLADEAAQDRSDAQDLYRVLENEVVPLYYDRDGQGLPQGWLRRVRRAMETSIWRFSTHRMLAEYFDRLYLPASRT